MTVPTGESMSYEATNGALTSFADTAGNVLSEAERITLPIVNQAASAISAAERLEASMGQVGMSDETLNREVRVIRERATRLKAAVDKLSEGRSETMEAALSLDQAARVALDTHVKGQGGVQEAFTAAGGGARSRDYYER
jgi:hypothetical protein